jgi:menaquinone-dependent protoporphyrinogen IX oxidase
MPEPNRKVVVIYKSKYGSTKRYAQWIADEVKADLFDGSKIGVKDLLKYDTIVFGGSLHAVGIRGLKLISDNLEGLRDKKLVIYATGASPVREKTTQFVFESNFSEEVRGRINFFYLRGAFDYKRLNLIDKTLMNMLKFKIKRKKPEELDADSKGLLASYNHPVDWTNKKAITPLVECIKG